MKVVYARCGGIDVHKKVLSVCSVWTDEQGEHIEEAQFGTYTRDLQALASGFEQRGVLDVAMEATGPYWRPVWNVLEARGLRLRLANPSHIRAIPGHKTDRRDARWLAELHRYGLVPASFVPNAQQRRLREVTRMRSKVVQDHSRVELPDPGSFGRRQHQVVQRGERRDGGVGPKHAEGHGQRPARPRAIGRSGQREPTGANGTNWSWRWRASSTATTSLSLDNCSNKPGCWNSRSMRWMARSRAAWMSARTMPSNCGIPSRGSVQ